MKVAYKITSGKMKISGFVPMPNLPLRHPMFAHAVANAAFKAHAIGNPGLYRIKTAMAHDSATVPFPKRIPLSKLL